MSLYPAMFAFVSELCPRWRRSQRVNLTLLCQALVARRSLTLTQLARAYPVPGRRKVPRPNHGLLHRVKRLWRFLAHPTLDETDLRQRLVRLASSACRTPGLDLPVLLDLTYFAPFAVLAASIPRGGRALPVAWRVFRRDLEGEVDLSQNLIIDEVLATLRAQVSPGIRVQVVADREFARASLFRTLRQQHSSFVIRVDAETWIHHPCYTGPMADLPLRPGGPRVWLPDARYGKTEQEPVHLLAVWGMGHRAPWLLATDLADPRQVERLYRKRMKIEHGFRDWKHHLRLKGTVRLRTAAHLGRLLTAVIVLYWFLGLLGTRLNRPPWRAEVHAWGRLSDFTCALELLALDHPAATRAIDRLLRWVADKLCSLRPPPPLWQLRRQRHRLPQRTG
jgi:hypothetical protein